MSYIPYYYDGDFQLGLVIFWAIVGVVSVVLGRRASLPSFRLKRRATVAAACALASILLYGVYVVQRQSVETVHHMVFGESQKMRTAR
jgi:hypothetical protein